MFTSTRVFSSAVVLNVAALAAGSLAACSGSSGANGPTVTLAVTDAASDELSTFVIGLESVELVPLVGAPVSLLQLPVAVDFAALTDLSRVLNVSAIPADTYTGVEVVLLFDNERVFVNGATTPAALLGTDGLPLTGTLTLSIDFPVPVVTLAGNYVLELDLDLNQSLDVDAGANEVYLEPNLLPRVAPVNPKEHALGGDLRTVVLAQNLFRVGLEALPGDPTPVVTVTVDSGTVFQLDGVCTVGLAGLAALDNLPSGTWVQAFGAMNASSSYFDAATVEAGTGSYNGGSDIVEGVITGRAGADLAVRGQSREYATDAFKFNLDYTVSTNLANTKVVRRGEGQLYDTDELNVGQKVRMFGLLTIGPPHTLDLTTATDVVRLEPTHVYGLANGAPNAGLLEINVARVDLRDVGDFNWAQGGATPADPAQFVISDPNNLGTGQGIVAGTPVEAVGFFSDVNDSGPDFVASSLVNRELTASLFLLRDRANGLTVTLPNTTASQIEFAFTGTVAGLEKAVIDQGFAGEVDLVATGLTVVPAALGLGIYTIRDRTLNTVSLHLTFASFSQGLQTALGSATLLNFGAIGLYDSGTDEITSALASAVVQ